MTFTRIIMQIYILILLITRGEMLDFVYRLCELLGAVVYFKRVEWEVEHNFMPIKDLHRFN